MLSLADTTDLLDQTTRHLMGESGPLTPQAGVALIDSWLEPLQAGENTRPLADQLTALKALLEASPLQPEAVQTAMSPVADELSLLATDMGGEGEMPALLEGLSSAMRQAANSSKADTSKSDLK
ncbi:hypothetical protein [Spirosoma pollinicola]|nr:hypothetical protein [Spirosoma pollinicola]